MVRRRLRQRPGPRSAVVAVAALITALVVGGVVGATRSPVGLPIPRLTRVTPSPTATGVLWAVDSTAPVGPDTLARVSEWYRGGVPTVWGRYLGDNYTLSRVEIGLAAAMGIDLLILLPDLDESGPQPICGHDRTAAQARTDVAGAIAAAHTAGLPRGVTLFKDLEQTTCTGEPSAAYLGGWYSALAGSGYGTGFYGNSAKATNQFPVAYCATARSSASFAAGVVLDAAEPEPQFHPARGAHGPADVPAWHPAVPSCAPAAATVVWQYAETGPSPGNVADLDEVLVGMHGLLGFDGVAT